MSDTFLDFLEYDRQDDILRRNYRERLRVDRSEPGDPPEFLCEFCGKAECECLDLE